MQPVTREAVVATAGEMRSHPVLTVAAWRVSAVVSNSESRRFKPRARGVVVSHPLRMRRALGSIPSMSTYELGFFVVREDREAAKTGGKKPELQRKFGGDVDPHARFLQGRWPQFLFRSACAKLRDKRAEAQQRHAQ